MDILHLDFDRANALAQAVAKLSLSPNFSTVAAPRVNADAEAALRAFLWTSAICHSTQGGLLGDFDGKTLKGWDFLLLAFCREAEASAESVSPDFIRTIAAEELLNLLKRHAAKTVIKLSDLERRAEILRGAAEELNLLFAGQVGKLIAESGGHVGGPSGLYALLNRLSAFRDDLNKKSTAFVTTVHFSEMIDIVDDNNVLPMIDYHRMRVLLRTGAVVIDDLKTRACLLDRKVVSLEVESTIRQASSDLCRFMAKQARMKMFDFDLLLWSHARSCCRNHPVCRGGLLESASFYELVTENFSGRCIFQSECLGCSDDAFFRLWEPKVETEDY